MHFCRRMRSGSEDPNVWVELQNSMTRTGNDPVEKRFETQRALQKAPATGNLKEEEKLCKPVAVSPRKPASWAMILESLSLNRRSRENPDNLLNRRPEVQGVAFLTSLWEVLENSMQFVTPSLQIWQSTEKTSQSCSPSLESIGFRTSPLMSMAFGSLPRQGCLPIFWHLTQDFISRDLCPTSPKVRFGVFYARYDSYN